GTHAGLGRLLGEGAVRVDVDPDLAATLDVTGHGDTSRLNLAVRHVRRGQRLDDVLAERNLRATLRHTGALGVVLLALLDPTGDQHVGQASVPVLSAGAAAGASALGASAAGACCCGLRPPRSPPRPPRAAPPAAPRAGRLPARAEAFSARTSAMFFTSPL